MGDYVPMYRRRRSGATNYNARRKAISSRGTLLAVRISGKNVSAQFLKPTVTGRPGSRVRALPRAQEARMERFAKVPAGVLPSRASGPGRTPSRRAWRARSSTTASRRSSRGSRISAFVKGVIDGGVEVPFSEEAMPSEERLKGENIAKYAAELAKDKEAYDKRFSGLLKKGFRPEDYAQNYARTKDAIVGAK